MYDLINELLHTDSGSTIKNYQPFIDMLESKYNSSCSGVSVKDSIGLQQDEFSPVFSELVRLQQIKYARDMAVQLHATSRLKKDSGTASKKSYGQIVTKKIKPAKRMTALFRTFRPLSHALTPSNPAIQPEATTDSHTVIISPHQKPSLVLNLADSRIREFPNAQRSFTFQILTSDGGYFLLQAPCEDDMDSWIRSLSDVAVVAGERLRTAMEQATKNLQLEIESAPANATESGTKLQIASISPSSA